MNREKQKFGCYKTYICVTYLGREFIVVTKLQHGFLQYSNRITLSKGQLFRRKKQVYHVDNEKILSGRLFSF